VTLKVMFEPEALPTTPLNVTCQEVPAGRPDSRKLTGTRDTKLAVTVAGVFNVTVTGLAVVLEQAEVGAQVHDENAYPEEGEAVTDTRLPLANHELPPGFTVPPEEGVAAVVSSTWVA
jgi:hypothetical protein